MNPTINRKVDDNTNLSIQHQQTTRTTDNENILDQKEKVVVAATVNVVQIVFPKNYKHVDNVNVELVNLNGNDQTAIDN